jgi:hypothetical protein
MKKLIPLAPLLIAMMLAASGCRSDENRRIAELAERQLERQDEQNRRIAEMQHEVAEGSRRLVESEAEARQDMITMHRDVQTERSVVGQQRDALEQDRRTLATQRHRDPIIAQAILQIGLLAACLSPLLVCWLLLRQPVEPADDREIAELLIGELISSDRTLLAGDPVPPKLEEPRSRSLPKPEDDDPPSSL